MLLDGGKITARTPEKLIDTVYSTKIPWEILLYFKSPIIL